MEPRLNGSSVFSFVRTRQHIKAFVRQHINHSL